jgi:glutamyl-Q tRNA(Asp) synthetase
MLEHLVEEWARRYPRAADEAPASAGSTYCGRFAPSPTGPLHLGSLVAALASWLDARAHGGTWLVRMEDLDVPREAPGAAAAIMAALAAYGLTPDGEVVRQSARQVLYRTAFMHLKDAGLIYPCGCTRREIADSLPVSGARGRETVYPGTCRQGLAIGRQARAWRLKVGDARVAYIDRAAGAMQQDLASETGDFVLLRADGQWAYQLAVVVDDAAQGVTHVVRGADLIGSTARQIYLQQRLGLPQPSYLHVPVVVNPGGEKLSKQSGAQALDVSPAGVAKTLDLAARHLFG